MNRVAATDGAKEIKAIAQGRDALHGGRSGFYYESPFTICPNVIWVGAPYS